jgi:hypothetical protein
MKPVSPVDRTNAAATPERSLERWNAASGYVVTVLGIAGAVFERGGPPFTAPIEEVVAFWSKYQRELLAQSVMFVLSAGAYPWFFASLRSSLMRADGAPARRPRLRSAQASSRQVCR